MKHWIELGVFILVITLALGTVFYLTAKSTIEDILIEAPNLLVNADMKTVFEIKETLRTDSVVVLNIVQYKSIAIYEFGLPDGRAVQFVYVYDGNEWNRLVFRCFINCGVST